MKYWCLERAVVQIVLLERIQIRSSQLVPSVSQCSHSAWLPCRALQCKFVQWNLDHLVLTFRHLECSIHALCFIKRCDLIHMIKDSHDIFERAKPLELDGPGLKSQMAYSFRISVDSSVKMSECKYLMKLYTICL